MIRTILISGTAVALWAGAALAAGEDTAAGGMGYHDYGTGPSSQATAGTPVPTRKPGTAGRSGSGMGMGGRSYMGSGNTQPQPGSENMGDLGGGAGQGAGQGGYRGNSPTGGGGFGTGYGGTNPGSSMAPDTGMTETGIAR